MHGRYAAAGTVAHQKRQAIRGKYRAYPPGSPGDGGIGAAVGLRHRKLQHRAPVHLAEPLRLGRETEPPSEKSPVALDPLRIVPYVVTEVQPGIRLRAVAALTGGRERSHPVGYRPLRSDPRYI